MGAPLRKNVVDGLEEACARVRPWDTTIRDRIVAIQDYAD
jgi:hypothetical protein